MEMNRTSLNRLATMPAFCFTGDTDWAPESMIEETLKIFEDNRIPYTPFITHKSKIIENKYPGEKSRYVGIHPNFLPGSSHGNDYDEIIKNVIAFWPGTKAFRSHSYFDNWIINQKLLEKGIKYDSNLSVHLQPGLFPLQNSAGLLRFPTFLEDYIYSYREKGWEVADVQNLLKTPGLKIFNFHPVHVCLNTPSLDHYARIKKDIGENNWKDLVYKGKGAQTFLLDLFKFIRQNSGLGIFYLDDLYSYLTGETREETFFNTSSPITHKKEVYEVSDDDQKAEIVRLKYEEIKDSNNIYATSRDFNFRELEIDFFKNGILQNQNGVIKPRILDIGCGNGYTIISLAKVVNAEFLGVDFSENMIGAAEHLREQFKPELISETSFHLGDVRKLDFEKGSFDFVLSARCLLNLPSQKAQLDAIDNVHRMLRKGGKYLMVEGTRDGLLRLNELRKEIGLEAIPDTADDNVSSLKFDEKESEDYLSKNFRIIKKHYFGMYYFISRVIHPALIYPDPPSFNSKMNELAKLIAMKEPDYKQLGHVRGLVLEAK